MNKQELESKFKQLEQEQASLIQQLQQLSVLIQENNGRLKLLKELRDSLSAEESNPRAETA